VRNTNETTKWTYLFPQRATETALQLLDLFLFSKEYPSLVHTIQKDRKKLLGFSTKKLQLFFFFHNLLREASLSFQRKLSQLTHTCVDSKQVSKKRSGPTERLVEIQVTRKLNPTNY